MSSIPQFTVVVLTFVLAGLVQQEFFRVQVPTLSLARSLPAYLKTCWAPFSSNYLDILEECCDWRIVNEPRNATILWTRDGPQEIHPEQMRLGRGQLYSLVEGTGIMTDKAELHKLLKAHKQLHLQPETYNLGSPDECRDFFLKARQDPSIVWVTKEPQNSQGEGIEINPDINALATEWLEDPNAPNEQLRCNILAPGEEDLVAQRYILNPLLLHKKKMEIRTYWVIASVDPFLAFYHDGTVRLTTKDYTIDDWKNPLIHITNTAQQKAADPNYHETEVERKWTLEQLGEYLEETKKVKNSEEYLEKTLRPQLLNILSIVAKAARPYLLQRKFRPGWDGRFELLGMDVILDSELKPWLTEIQMGPGISRDPGVKEKTLPAMLEEMTDILLEIDVELRLKGKVGTVKSAKSWRKIDV